MLYLICRMRRDLSFVILTALMWLESAGGHFWSSVEAAEITPLPGGLSASGDLFSLTRGQTTGAGAALVSSNAVPLPQIGGQISVGTPDQWRFFAFTNETGFPYAAFATFLASPLSPTFDTPDDATNQESGRIWIDADIDLYVTTNAALTTLDEGAIDGAFKSLGRGGNETILLDDAVPATYYLGVKSERHGGAEFSVLALSSERPLSEIGLQGELSLRGVPLPAAIPDATNGEPGVGLALAFAPSSLPVKQVLVSNVVTHTRFEDLRGVLTHGGRRVVLHNGLDLPEGTQTLIWDDQQQSDVPGARPTQGPGSLRDFMGLDAAGQWLFEITDEASGESGTNQDLSIIFGSATGSFAGVFRGTPPKGMHGTCLDRAIRRNQSNGQCQHLHESW